MKKFIIFAAAAAAVLTGCTKEMSTVDNSEDVQTITMNAGFADTKLAFEADGTGYKTTWTNSDIVRLFYNNYKTGGSGALFTSEGDVVPGDPATSATIKFNVTGIAELAKVANVKWGAYVTNGHEGDKPGYGYWTDEYGKQDGTEAAAQNLIFYYKGGTNLLDDLKNKVEFSCANTMLKFTLTFPDDVTATEATDITISAASGLYSTAKYSWGALADSASTKGNISIADQTISDKKITFYSTVAPATVKNVAVTAKVDGVLYKAVVDDTEEGKVLAAGKVYNVARTMVAQTITKWASYAAGSFEISDKTSTAASSADGVITYNAGNVTYTAATTGRTSTLTLSSGFVITVSQVEVSDFIGNYELHSKAYNASSPVSETTSEGNNKYLTTGIKFTGTSKYKELNGKTPNLVVTGLYYDFELPAFFELDEKNGPQLYFYLTNLEYQTCSNSLEIACIPEESKSSKGWNAYSTAPVKFGANDCNYFWLPWAVNFEDNKLTVGSSYPAVGDGNYCYGLAFVQKGYAAAKWLTIFQFNWGNVEMATYFEKK